MPDSFRFVYAERPMKTQLEGPITVKNGKVVLLRNVTDLNAALIVDGDLF